MGCGNSRVAFVPGVGYASTLLNAAPELRPIALQLELEIREPAMPVDDLHDFFMEMVEDVREPYDTPGCLSFEAFMKRLGIGDSTPLQSKLFEQLDLNASGEIDFQEFLWGAWHFSLLQSDDSLVRFLFDLYEEKGIMRWSKVHECIMDVNGPHTTAACGTQSRSKCRTYAKKTPNAHGRSSWR